MNWKILSVKLPPAVHAALMSETKGQPATFVRQLLAERLGVEYEERRRGLASSSEETKRRVGKAGAKARWATTDDCRG